MEIGHPFLQLSERRKRDRYQGGVEPNQFFKDVGLMQLHQMLGSEHSGKVPQEDQSYRLRLLRETDYSSID